MLFGNIKPRVTLQMKPLPKPYLPSASPSQPSADPLSVSKEAPTELRSLFELLPSNIVLPSSAVLMVGVYRQLLQAQMAGTLTEESRALPQSGHNARSDLMLSAFPQIVSDEACVRVCMYIWALECPPTAIGGNFHTMSSHDLVKGSTMKAFRAVVLRLWRAWCSPAVRLSRTKGGKETASETAAREKSFLKLIGLEVRDGGIYPVFPLVTKGTAAAGTDKFGMLDVKKIMRRNDEAPGLLTQLQLGDHSVTPFCLKELQADVHLRHEF